MKIFEYNHKGKFRDNYIKPLETVGVPFYKEALAALSKAANSVINLMASLACAA